MTFACVVVDIIGWSLFGVFIGTVIVLCLILAGTLVAKR